MAPESLTTAWRPTVELAQSDRPPPAPLAPSARLPSRTRATASGELRVQPEAALRGSDTSGLARTVGGGLLRSVVCDEGT
jgi:hypothetical protein